MQRALLPEIFQEIDVLVRSRYPIIYLTSHEEERVLNYLKQIAQGIGKDCYAWSVTAGLEDITPNAEKLAEVNHFNDPADVLEHINKSEENAIFILKDFHFYMEDFVIIRRLRDLFSTLKVTRKNVIILAPSLRLPDELNKEITVVDVPLPEASEFLQLVQEIDQSTKEKSLVQLQESEVRNLARAAHGLTLTEAENVFSKAIVCQSKLTIKGLPFILNEKKQIVRKSGILEFYASEGQIGELGGFNSLKHWLRQRGEALFSDKARRFGLPAPKGILLLGPPGTGKSLTAKIVSNYWQLPLLKLDFGKIFSGLVGSSEENMRQALKTAEGLSPCVLWIDEIEKGLAGGKSGSSDGGTAARVFGSLLTWMQEKKSTVFVIATANDISKLPPELMRKGRFDEIFFLDLPNVKEREEIFRIHITKARRSPTKFDLARFAAETAEFTGAEIEQVITAALFSSFSKKRDVENDDILKAIAETIPLSKTYSKELGDLREWAKLRARKA